MSVAAGVTARPVRRKTASARGMWAAEVTSKTLFQFRDLKSSTLLTAFSRVLRLSLSSAMTLGGTPSSTSRSAISSASVFETSLLRGCTLKFRRHQPK
jgi:hypothetical protein